MKLSPEILCKMNVPNMDLYLFSVDVTEARRKSNRKCHKMKKGSPNYRLLTDFILTSSENGY